MPHISSRSLTRATRFVRQAAAMASSWGWSDMIVPAILIGVLGYTIGGYYICMGGRRTSRVYRDSDGHCSHAHSLTRPLALWSFARHAGRTGPRRCVQVHDDGRERIACGFLCTTTSGFLSIRATDARAPRLPAPGHRDRCVGASSTFPYHRGRIAWNGPKQSACDSL